MKTKKNEEYKESQITTMSIFGFTFFIKNYILLKNIVVKGKKVKSSLYHHICAVMRNQSSKYTNIIIII